jgi:hypothetical protein
VMFDHQLVGGDAGTVFGGDLVDLCPIESSLESGSASSGSRVLWPRRAGL